MQTVLYSIILLFTSSVLLLIGCGGSIEHQLTSQEEADCLALTRINNLTITSAELMEATDINFSPIMMLFRDSEKVVAQIINNIISLPETQSAEITENEKVYLSNIPNKNKRK